VSGDSYERTAYQVQAAVATLTLNRPNKRNALDDLTIAELKQSFLAAEADANVKVIVLRGAGHDFCAGADLSQLEKIAAGGTREENLADAMKLGDLLIQMRRMGKPIVAAVHGNALAGGAGLATACDLIIADANAVFGYPEVKLGFVPAMVMPLLVRRVGEKTAFELTAFGGVISAAEAQRLGLVNHVTTGNFDHEVTRYTAELAGRSASAVQLIKRLLYGIDGLSFEAAVAHGAEINVAARMTEDCREGVRKFLDSRRK
jgi:methylglutaconyl-CoA hydratase